jgi:hypothetical protein
MKKEGGFRFVKNVLSDSKQVLWRKSWKSELAPTGSKIGEKSVNGELSNQVLFC